MTPIGQHFLIHFIHPPLWLWNTEHLGNPLRMTAAEPDPPTPTHSLNTHYFNLHKLQKKPEKLETQFVAAEPSMKLMSDSCPCFPASIMCPPGTACNYSWRMAEQMRGLWVRLQWVPGSLDNRWCLLCFRGICAAPVDRVAPHLLPNISCLIFVVFFPHLPSCCPLPQVGPVHEKDPAELFSPSTTSWKSSTARLGPVCYLWRRLTWTPLRRPPSTFPISPPAPRSLAAIGRRQNTQMVYYPVFLSSNQTPSSYLKAAAGSLHSLPKARNSGWIRLI